MSDADPATEFDAASEAATPSAVEPTSAGSSTAARAAAAFPRRRAALISTAIAVPVTVLAALALTSGRDTSSKSTSPPPPLTLGAIAPNPGADAVCYKIIQRLPVTLSGMAPRRVFSTSSFIVAWGDPPVILRCGVQRPASLVPGSSDFITQFSDDHGLTAQWLPTKEDHDVVWTTVDRSVYVEVTVPARYEGAAVINPITTSVAGASPAVCQVAANSGPPAPAETLCVNRK